MKVNIQRVFLIFLSLACILPLFCVGASAEGAFMPGQYDVVDILDSAFVSDTQRLSVSGALNTYALSCTVTSNSSFKTVYIGVTTSPSSGFSTPNSVTLQTTSASFTGTFSYRVGSMDVFSFNLSRSISGACSVIVSYGSQSQRTVGISYFVGLVSGQLLSSTFYLRYRSFNASWTYSGNNAIPYKARFDFDIPNSSVGDSPTNTNIVTDFDVQFIPPIDNADYFTFHLVVPQFTWRDRYPYDSALVEPPSFFLVDGLSGGSNRSLPILDSQIYLDSTTNVGIGRRCYHYIYTVSLSGFDYSLMSDPRVSCRFTQMGAKSTVGSSTTSFLYNFDVLSCCFGVNADDGGAFRSFASWLNSKLDSLASTIAGALNPSASDEVTDSQQTVDNKVDSMNNFEQEQLGSLDSGMSNVQGVVSGGIGSFGSALAFVQTYTTNIAGGINKFLIVFTLPIFVGIFLYACSRAPGVTSAFRDRRPKE